MFILLLSPFSSRRGLFLMKSLLLTISFKNGWMVKYLLDHGLIISYLTYAAMIARGEVLVLRYEDMVRDLPTHVERLVKFLDLGGGDDDDDNDDDGALTKDDWECLLPSFGFERMKKDLNGFQPKSVAWRHNFQFLRKGVL
eukprot:39932_1